jgi:hypothetical protein
MTITKIESLTGYPVTRVWPIMDRDILSSQLIIVKHHLASTLRHEYLEID